MWYVNLAIAGLCLNYLHLIVASTGADQPNQNFVYKRLKARCENQVGSISELSAFQRAAGFDTP